ncbi:MAG: tetratricopeptide repeat protein [Alphaproteobacteria bacterium]
MTTVAEAFAEAVDHYRGNRLDEGEGLCRLILETVPDQPGALYLLSVILVRARRPAEAVEPLFRLGAVHPDHAGPPGLLEEVGCALLDLGRHGEAETCFRRALDLRPDLRTIHVNLGNALLVQSRFDEAEAAFARGAERHPDYAEAWHGVGVARAQRGHPDAAVEALRRAVALNPDLHPAYAHLGFILLQLGRNAEAEKALARAVSLAPADGDSHVLRGKAQGALVRLDDAAESFRRAHEIRPDDTDTLLQLGDTLVELSRLDEAREAYGRAIALRPERLGWRVRSALAQPLVPASAEEIAATRARLTAALDDIRGRSGTIDDPVAEVGRTTFDLAYHGLDDLPFQRTLAEIYLAACPDLGWTAPHLRNGPTPRDTTPRNPTPRPAGARIRIGFISEYLWHHTIGKLNRGFIAHLSRESFEVLVLRPPSRRDDTADAIDRSADRVVQIPGNLDEARRVIADLRLDALFYLDVGMMLFTYFLAYSRLAPVQAAIWGHPMTTGSPSMDYFLSATDMETPDGQAYYTERLIPLRHLPHFQRPPMPEPGPRPVRETFGLPTDARLYVCPQSLFKFHPDFDRTLSAILHGDPRGRLVLIGARYPHWNSMLLERFRITFGDAVERVVFLPYLREEDFLRLVADADAVLDTTPFCGGNSSLETFAMGAPIVTWPTRFLRGRITTAIYRAMGMDDLIVDSHEAYVAAALRLATDPDFQATMRARVVARAPVLYENMDAVRELERFFTAAVAAAERGAILPGWPLVE